MTLRKSTYMSIKQSLKIHSLQNSFTFKFMWKFLFKNIYLRINIRAKRKYRKVAGFMKDWFSGSSVHASSKSDREADGSTGCHLLEVCPKPERINYGPWATFSLPPVFVNKMVLTRSHVCLCVCYLWLISCCKDRVESFNRD